jgi:hypothetical protein
MNPKELWSSDDSVSFREFLRRVPKQRILATMRAKCPAVVDVDTALRNDSEAIARVAAMRAGWDAYEETLFELADINRKPALETEYKDMT